MPSDCGVPPGWCDHWIQLQQEVEGFVNDILLLPS